jgi:serine/threonine protein kinase
MEGERRRISDALPAYDVTGEIGRGAWGVVYAARHRQLGRAVAIKQLPTAFGADPDLRARFTSEAQLIASLDHPHIVPVYDYLERDGLYLIVMEHLSGGTLWDRFSGDGLGQDEAVAILLAVCSALDHAHERGVLHRDVKPENVLLTASGTPKLTDFGIAKLLTSTRTALTQAGTAMGTPAYMAPEQARAAALSPATDVYSCGVMLYEMLSGTLPFPESADPVVQLYQQVHEEARPLATAAPGVPAGLCQVVMQALEKDPTARYPSAVELGVSLAEAATAAWGPGWVGPTGVTVMDRGRISSVTERATGPTRRPSSPTIIVQGGDPHPQLEPIEPIEPIEGRSTDATEPTEEVTRGAAAEREPAEVTGMAANPETTATDEVTAPRVLTPLTLGEQPPRRTTWKTYAAIGGAAVVIFVASAAVTWAIRDRDDGTTVATDTTADPATDTTATTVPTTERTPPTPIGRYVTLDGISVEAGTYVVRYTPYRFTPDIGDPDGHHVHFFWDTYEPEQAGIDAPERGAEVGAWELWDADVFDAFAVADRPPGAEQICAVVATYDHRVDDPDNVDCIELPS